MAELWIPRTAWEKRRQLSAAIHRSIVIGRRMLVLSCEYATTFFGRLDLDKVQVDRAISEGQLEFMQVSPLQQGMDLSRVLGEIGLRYKANKIDQVVVDDVDLMVDMASSDATVASLFALLYALKARFSEITFFSNPLNSEAQIRNFASAQEFLAVHLPAHLNNAA